MRVWFIIRLTGFEPTTSRVGVWHSIQLSYSRITEGIIANFFSKVNTDFCYFQSYFFVLQ